MGQKQSIPLSLNNKNKYAMTPQGLQSLLEEDFNQYFYAMGGGHSLPPDLEFEILIRLPIKSLTRFRCVCRAWSFLISYPLFQQLYCIRSQQNPSLFAVTNYYDHAHRTLTLHACTYNKQGGLIKKFSKKLSNFSYPMPGSYDFTLPNPLLLCNPSTEEVIPLPQAPGYIACFGVGFTTSTHELKVVRFFQNVPTSSANKMHCEVFTLGTSIGWRETTTPPYYLHGCRIAAPFLHGALHLLPEKETSTSRQFFSILVFNIDSENYREISLPQCFVTRHDTFEYQSQSLAVLHGSLCLQERQIDFATLWVLEDYSSGQWVKEYTVDLSSVHTDPLWRDNVGIIWLNVCARGDEEYVSTYKDVGQMMVNKFCSATHYAESFMPVGCWLICDTFFHERRRIYSLLYSV